MKTGIPMNKPAVAALPKHLLQFAVDQRYDDYTPVDHAVWRFIMRQNIFFLKEYAHKVYFQGLLDTGISFERIPRIDEMNTRWRTPMAFAAPASSAVASRLTRS